MNNDEMMRAWIDYAKAHGDENNIDPNKIEDVRYYAQSVLWQRKGITKAMRKWALDNL